MRRTLAVALVLMSLAAVAGAETRGDTRVTVYASNFEAGWSEGNGSFARTGYALGLSYFLKPRWSVELSYGSEPRTIHSSRFVDFGNGTFGVFDETRRVNAHPLDVVGRFHFTNGTRWKPFVGLGARWLDRPDGFGESPIEDEFQPQVVVGTAFELTPRLSLHLDGKRLLREPAPWDEETKFSAGVGWKF